jgi:hypothetical protein
VTEVIRPDSAKSVEIERAPLRTRREVISPMVFSGAIDVV